MICCLLDRAMEPAPAWVVHGSGVKVCKQFIGRVKGLFGTV